MNRKIIVSVSGGKDSTAMLLKALDEHPKKNIIPVFCDTGWEHPVTYEYLNYLEKTLNIEITRIKNKRFDGLLDMIRKKKMFPTSDPKYHYCSYELKKVPIRQFLKQFKEPVENWVGIRAQESKNRERRYSGISPDELLDYADTDTSSPKYCHIHKTRFPIIDLSLKDIMKFYKKRNIKLNPLYYEFNSRVGCYPCILSGMQDWKIIYKSDIGKSNILKLVELEKELNRFLIKKTKIKPNKDGQEILRLLENDGLQLFPDEDIYYCHVCNI
ncbi:MAG: phosphoadenosine phosphosulfate reductase domain-containing protein [bacterium]